MVEYHVIGDKKTRIVICKGEPLTPKQQKKLSVKTKLLAILELHPTIGFCEKHKIYYKIYRKNELEEIWLCPLCYEEKFGNGQ